MLKGKKFDAFTLRSLMQSASPDLYFAIYRLGEVLGSRLH